MFFNPFRFPDDDVPVRRPSVREIRQFFLERQLIKGFDYLLLQGSKDGRFDLALLGPGLSFCLFYCLLLPLLLEVLVDFAMNRRTCGDGG